MEAGPSGQNGPCAVSRVETVESATGTGHVTIQCHPMVENSAEGLTVNVASAPCPDPARRTVIGVPGLNGQSAVCPVELTVRQSEKGSVTHPVLLTVVSLARVTLRKSLAAARMHALSTETGDHGQPGPTQL